MQARVFGETAVVTGRLTVQGQDESDLPRTRFLHVYVERKGKWRLVAAHSTNLPRDAG
jgi:hypothetical protein